ncbi:hypothetical protein OG21DRAFT_1502041 [Imleria badia]|nr:hypothetical protein OG21DRAFT_1502048 [Imleria badia]KAF8546190.1 hypothetical protein OG21DRAFT_1502041 [Imleria badia]
MRCCRDCFPKMTITPQFSTLRYKTDSYYLKELDLPMSFSHDRLSDDSSLDIKVTTETLSPVSCFSLLDWNVAQSRKRPRNVSTGEFLVEQNDFWASVHRHTTLCRIWDLRRLKAKAAQLSLVRKQRVEDIKAELEELGWTDVVSSMICDSDLLRLPQVRKLEPLTPTEWAKIRPEVISWARKVRQAMAWNHCMDTFTSVSQTVQQELKRDSSLKIQPRGIDIAMLPAVRSVLESNSNSDMSDHNHDDLKKKLFRVLPPAIKKWSSDAVEELEQFAREELSLPPLSKPSRLLSVIFRCKVCSRNFRRHQRLRFDEVLSHHHLYEEKPEGKSENTGEMALHDTLVMGYHTYHRNIQVLRVDVTVSRRVENLVRRMGQNPSRVTYDELRHSTVKVICGLCRPQVATRMNFEQAVRGSVRFFRCLHLSPSVQPLC